MKQWGAFALTLILLGAALVASEKQRIATPVGPDAVLSLVADSQRELTRLPARFTRMSDLDEIKIGNNLAKMYLSEGSSAKELPSTRAVQVYVSKVGARVSVGAERKLPYQFHYISDYNFINAFALPGGHVFIGAGLMALMDSEDELANVLGHEVEHIDRRHCAERIQTQAALQKVPLGELAAIPVEVFEEGYSKEQELEADREGTRLAVKARYSPLGAVRMFQTFDTLYGERQRRAQSPQEELSQIAEGMLEGYFRSHPPAPERIAQIQGMISAEHWESLTSEQPLEVAYVFMTQRAARALAANNFAAAEAGATRSLSLHADQTDALAILAQAQFGRMDFSAAEASYKQLLKESPTEAATVGEFAFTISKTALNAKHFPEAAKYAAAYLDLQPNNASALTVLADAQLAMGNYPEAGSTYQHLLKLYPDSAGDVVTYAASTARRVMDEKHYQQALDVSSFWLTLSPNAVEALTIQANAGVALGNFAAAAKACRRLLDLTPKDAQVDVQQVWRYADALSVANLGQAGINDFRTFMETRRPASTTTIESQIRIEYAGLALMAGDPSPAKELVKSQEVGGGSEIPLEIMGRLGWWYYRAGKYSEAQALLQHLVQMRPGESGLRNDLAWVELEQNQLEYAIRLFRTSEFGFENDTAQWNNPQMGLAIALWRSHQIDEALKAHATAAYAEPRWTNPLLVRTFYSPQVAQSVADMEAESARRLEARKHRR